MRLRAGLAALGPAFGLGLGFVAVSAAHAATVTVAPVRDTAIYGEAQSNGNGSGWHLFAGKTRSFHTRRALLAFDVASAIPAGATVTDVTLTLRVSRTPDVPVLDDHPFSLHRLTADWGEGASDAPGAEGSGTPAAPGDATWSHRFAATLMTWATAGGDFVAPASASLEVGGIGHYEWESTPQLVADVQGWLDDPPTAFGWIVLGDEFDIQTARRFDSVQNPTPAYRPQLTVTFDAPPSAAGAVPDGDDVPGDPLRLERLGPGDHGLDWSPSCAPGDQDYAVYLGVLGVFAERTALVCSTGGATQLQLPPEAPIDRFFLVVPTNGTAEGSYGRDSDDVERAPAPGACLAWSVGDPVCAAAPAEPSGRRR